VGAACLAVVMVTACQGGPVSHPALPHPAARVTITTGNLTFTSAVTAGGGQRARNAPVVTRSAAGGLIDRRPDLGVSVSVSGGTLSGVAVTSGSGKVIPGGLGAGATWHTTWALEPSQAYHVAVTAVNGLGRRTVAAVFFRAMTPRRTFSASTTIGTHQTFGVGMPIMVTFSHPITDRGAVERALEIRSSKPVIGAWYWMSSTQVWFRTRNYWPTHTRVWLVAISRACGGQRGQGRLVLQPFAAR
jgi:hypothetical protein